MDLDKLMPIKVKVCAFANLRRVLDLPSRSLRGEIPQALGELQLLRAISYLHCFSSLFCPFGSL